MLVGRGIITDTGGGGGGFVSFRSTGTRVFGPTDGVGGHALVKPTGYQSGDLLVVSMNSTSETGSSSWPTETGTWSTAGNAQNRFWWRVATGDSSDDFTTGTFTSTTHTAIQMCAFDITGYGTITQVAGASLLSSSTLYGTSWPAPGWSQYNNNQTVNISIYYKKTTVRQTPTAVDASTYLSSIAAATGTTDSGEIDSYWGMGQNNNSAANATVWGGWCYHIADTNPAGAITFGDDIVESPNSSGSEVVSHYGIRLRVTV